MRSAHRFTVLAAALIGALAMLALPSVAAAKDRNHDRIPDRWEKRHHLSLNVNQARRDQDSDQLRNRAEFLAGDNPRNADSDGDGIPDGEENAGKIASFDAETGKLTIDLFGGETITGLITEETEIECSNSGTASASDSQQGQQGEDDNGGQQGDDDGEQQGEQSGSDDGEEPGDDNGGDGEEPGDDNGGDGSGSGNPGGGTPCTSADLTPGATVHEAELHLENGTAIFEKVELGN
ncbi:MAG TPA: hypothetical protein VG816_04980 [Solirubrobacterales bacterium]|nr:hypothetical protein [Solirubrobacterales bacterium]